MSVTYPRPITTLPSAEQPAAAPEAVRRRWLKRRVAISEHAVDLIAAIALGDLPDDTITWPTPAWAGAYGVAHAA